MTNDGTSPTGSPPKARGQDLPGDGAAQVTEEQLTRMSTRHGHRRQKDRPGQGGGWLEQQPGRVVLEDVTLSFLRHAWPDEAAAQYGQFWGEKCAWVYMAHQAGVGTEDPKDFDAARQAIEATFPEEVAFLRAMPTILLNDRYLFVHGGVPREDRLEDLTARACMKNDDFLNQGHAFQRWVIVATGR